MRRHLVGRRCMRLVLATLAAFSLGAAACTIERGDVRTPSGEPPEADSVRVRQAVEAIARAYGAGDMATLDTIYHDSVTVYEGGRVDRGWSDYRDSHLGPEFEALSERSLRFDDIRVRLTGSTAWATFRFELDAIGAGQPFSVTGVGTMVFRRYGGRWQLVHSHTSTSRN